MTEDEWLICDDPHQMVEFLIDKASNRKLILFCLYWCPLYWMERANGDPAYDRALQFAETRENLDLLRLAWGDSDSELWMPCLPEWPVDWAIMLTDSARQEEYATLPPRHAPPFLRDIYGNPFGPIAFDASWLTSTVVAIAQGMYDSHDFDAMPVLADAIQDAGCDNADILTHCRGDGPHVRGCWVIDAILGKA